MYQIICSVLFLVPMLAPSIAIAGWFGPSDYDECIIEGMRGVQSDVAAQLVRRSCLKKFSLKELQESEMVNLPPDALAMLSVGGDLGYSDFSGSIYNGNSDWTVEELTVVIEVATPNVLCEFIECQATQNEIREAKRYRIAISAPPYTSKSFSIETGWRRPIIKDGTLIVGRDGWRVSVTMEDARGHR